MMLLEMLEVNQCVFLLESDITKKDQELQHFIIVVIWMPGSFL